MADGKDGTMFSWTNQIGFSQPHSKVAELTRAHHPLLINIQGLPGSGKTHLLHELKRILPAKDYAFFETWKIISLLSHGLDNFVSFMPHNKLRMRKDATVEIARDCTVVDKVGIATGYHYLWDEMGEGSQDIDTPVDTDAYDMVLWLQVPVEELADRRMSEPGTGRRALHTDEQKNTQFLGEWQDGERERLQKICGENNVQFECIDVGTTTSEDVAELVRKKKGM
ncbi:hypothetical protein AUEXF2481DRAFT_225247 [Aureobasidium subglaciale EXF-2481]|uniref:NadR/Ttd14 AAA domain-containing protein n=1 Tax=Aureobasidium subglaciale (strain EXF-2481) TaxID=1043005 RepID=A0A074YFR5_AURSE|nr:uncharacterized protein AUEXF2481DRAFT_225247 [Aureobasidium subglaciale EXF-2481]KEQ94909.1 hypothetical protein AUEXF2481DRAFT_225247 [Aureobasidium subglaciale EXF-2481]